MVEEREWLLVKRDLYFRPEACGYTGIRDQAGRYTEAEAKDYAGDGDLGVSMIRLEDAPEFTKSCFPDLARDHLIKQRDFLRAELEQAKRERDVAAAAMIRNHERAEAAERLAGARVKVGPLAHVIAEMLERAGEPRPNGDILHDILAQVIPAALAEPAGEVEPVGYLVRGFDGGPFFSEDREQYDRQGHAVVPVYTTPPASAIREAAGPDDAVSELFVDAWAEAEKAMRKFPQPNYVISKVAEEAGEVVKAAIHCAEGRESAENVAGEIKQAMAMLIRLFVEGDQVHGLPSIRAALAGSAE